MNDELKNQLAEKLLSYLGALEQGLQKGADFAADQLPSIANEIIYFGIAESGIWFLLGATLIWLGVSLVRWLRKEGAEEECVMALFPVLPGVALVVYNLLSIAKASLAPRLFILEYIKELVK